MNSVPGASVVSGCSCLDHRCDLACRRGTDSPNWEPVYQAAARAGVRPAWTPWRVRRDRCPQIVRPLVAAGKLVSPDHDHDVASRLPLRMVAPATASQAGFLIEAARAAPALAHPAPSRDPPRFGSPRAPSNGEGVTGLRRPVGTSGAGRPPRRKGFVARCTPILTTAFRVVYLTSAPAGAAIPEAGTGRFSRRASIPTTRSGPHLLHKPPFCADNQPGPTRLPCILPRSRRGLPCARVRSRPGGGRCVGSKALSRKPDARQTADRASTRHEPGTARSKR